MDYRTTIWYSTWVVVPLSCLKGVPISCPGGYPFLVQGAILEGVPHLVWGVTPILYGVTLSCLEVPLSCRGGVTPRYLPLRKDLGPETEVSPRKDLGPEMGTPRKDLGPEMGTPRKDLGPETGVPPRKDLGPETGHPLEGIWDQRPEYPHGWQTENIIFSRTSYARGMSIRLKSNR